MNAQRALAPRAAPPVEVALLNLDAAAGDLARFQSWLDADERARAASFRFALHRDRFVARRGEVRRRLAETLGCAPGEIAYAVTEHGKPFVPDAPWLHFSVSHSAGLALLATSRSGEIGCDIERRDPALACPAVAAKLFAPDEVAALAALAGDAWVEGFFNCWTRKEALVKALGLGLSYPLDAFTVSLAPGHPPRLLAGGDGWALDAWHPAPGFTAALARRDD